MGLTGPVSTRAERFIEAVEPRIREVVDRKGEDRIVEFVPANYQLIARALRRISDDALAPGHRFVEWGSGLGVVTCLAAMEGFCATGIEIDEGLVQESREIARRHSIEADFVCGSYRVEGETSIEADLVYAYPWPAEEWYVLDEFQRRAPAGCLLLTFHGGGDLRLRTQEPS